MKAFSFLLITFLFSGFCVAQYKVRFEINQTGVIHSSDTIFIAGNFNGWNPSLKNYGFISNQSGKSTYEIKLAGGNYEYKFTRGNWSKAESMKDGKDTPNRNFFLKKDTVIHAFVAGWKDDFPQEQIVKKHTASAQVKIIDSAFAMPQLGRQRKIWVYLPVTYEAANKRYPVIYMHDGQNLFDEATSGFGEWGVDEYLDSIAEKGKKESIIIGIDNGSKRMNEYNPYYFARAGKGEGKEYVDFLVKTLKPYIDSNFRTLTDKQNTFIAGSSMGGLISLYAVLRYPSVFGGAGIFSPAFWTADEMDKDIERLSPAVNAKLFFYAGEKESDKMVADMKRVETKIKIKSKSPVTEIVDPEAGHNEAAWRKYFPEFYQWILNIK